MLGFYAEEKSQDYESKVRFLRIERKEESRFFYLLPYLIFSFQMLPKSALVDI